mgnify:CR=1 FL=1
MARGKGASSNRPLNVALKESLVKALNNGRFSLDDVPVHGAVLTKNKKAHWQTILYDMKAEYFSLYAGRGLPVEHDSQIQSAIASKRMTTKVNEIRRSRRGRRARRRWRRSRPSRSRFSRSRCRRRERSGAQGRGRAE